MKEISLQYGTAVGSRPAEAVSLSTLRKVLLVVALLAGVGVLAQFTTAFRAVHEITQVESIVAFHGRMLALGEGIYYDLQQYPFTISPYGPLFYSMSAVLQSAGIAPLAAGRWISMAALLGIFYLCWRLLLLHTGDRIASAAGAVLVAVTANLLKWGTVGQTDALGLVFSLAAFHQYSRYRIHSRFGALWWSGLFIALAIFTKQSFLAAGAAVTLLLIMENRRRGFAFAAVLGACGASLALSLNLSTGGGYFDNAIFANLNPFSAGKAWDHLGYFLPVSGSLWIIILAGLVSRRTASLHPFHLYLAAAAAVMAMTVPKVGSDLNYQMETMVLLCLLAAWTLHRLDFFPLLARRDPGWVTLLQIPLLLYVVLNLSLTAKTVVEHNMLENIRRQEMAALRPYFESARGPVLSVQIDPLLHAGLPMEVEPLIYTLLVDAGMVDPTPVLRDLSERRFGLVVLYEDVTNGRTLSNNPEVPSLPDAHLEEIRTHYRLAAHVPGPLLDGDYLYVPIDEAEEDQNRGENLTHQDRR